MPNLITFDDTGKKFYESGVDHGVFYPQDVNGAYPEGFAWNGLINVTESPSGAEANKQYADNIPYLTLLSAEEFGATIEAYTFPDAFALVDGSAEPQPGVLIGQQTRKTFGLCYRTKIGNDVGGQDLGYKLHLVYGCLASPSEKSYSSVNDSPEALTFSWEITTTPVAVVGYKPTSLITIDSTKVTPGDLAAFETILYGSTPSTKGRMPLPAEVFTLLTPP